MERAGTLTSTGKSCAMGLLLSFARTLLEAKQRGVCFDRILTAGRQQWLVPPTATKRLHAKFNLSAATNSQLVFGGYADAFFQEWLGARETVAIDASDYEGATRIHDLNCPVPAEWNESFDVVIDAGTLEHVFNFPAAIESCLRMLKVGGTIFWSMPANNYCGHGFYQFSPELIFRIFSHQSGFNIEQLLLFTHPFPGAELSSRMKFYSVRNPDEVRSRVAFMNDAPTGLLVQARRERHAILFNPTPQQSDYAQAWRGTAATQSIFTEENAGFLAEILNHSAVWLDRNLPRPARNWLAGQYQKHFLLSLNNRGLFRRLRDK
jgi:SAM-dependent methyltransferase